jgi:hypothetical protein
MPTLLTRRAAVLFKLETLPNEGIDALPVPASDGVLVEQPLRITFNPNVIDTTEVTPSLDSFDPIVGGTSVSIEFDCYLKGCANPGTTAPEWSKILMACGFAEAQQSAAIPVAAESVAAGASPIQATLGAGAAATANLYRGMPIQFTSGNVLTSFIYDYSAAKLAKITDTAAGSLTTGTFYQIPPHVRYTPASSSVQSATIYVYNDGVLYKFVGCRGTCPLTLTSGGPARISFRFMGMFASKTDAALPTVTYDNTRPPIWKNGAFTINSVAAAGQTMSIDPGNNLVMPDNPNSIESFDPAIITSRQIRGNINPKETLVATRDSMLDFRTSVKRPLHARLGITVGNRIGVTVPSALYLNQSPTDTNGYVTVDVPFHATGQDAGYSITIF